MKQLLKIVTLVMITLNTATAAVPLAGLPCELSPASINRQQLRLSPGQHNQQLFILYNQSSRPIMIDRALKNRSASAGWISELAAGRYSAILVKQPGMLMKCLRKSKQRLVPCQKVLMVCAVNHADFKSASAGSYWVAENQDKQQLLDAIRQRGIAF